jgi:hypothetical protein
MFGTPPHGMRHLMLVPCVTLVRAWRFMMLSWSAFASHKEWVEKHGEISAAGLAKLYLQQIKFAKAAEKTDEMSDAKVKVALQVFHSLLRTQPILQRIQKGFDDFGCAFWLFRQCRTCLRESMLLSDLQRLHCPSGRPPRMAVHSCIVVSFSGTFDTGRLSGIEKKRLFSSVVKGKVRSPFACGMLRSMFRSSVHKQSRLHCGHRSLQSCGQIALVMKPLRLQQDGREGAIPCDRKGFIEFRMGGQASWRSSCWTWSAA